MVGETLSQAANAAVQNHGLARGIRMRPGTASVVGSLAASHVDGLSISLRQCGATGSSSSSLLNPAWGGRVLEAGRVRFAWFVRTIRGSGRGRLPEV